MPSDISPDAQPPAPAQVDRWWWHSAHLRLTRTRLARLVLGGAFQ